MEKKEPVSIENSRADALFLIAKTNRKVEALESTYAVVLKEIESLLVLKHLNAEQELEGFVNSAESLKLAVTKELKSVEAFAHLRKEVGDKMNHFVEDIKKNGQANKGAELQQAVQNIQKGFSEGIPSFSSENIKKRLDELRLLFAKLSSKEDSEKLTDFNHIDSQLTETQKQLHEAQINALEKTKKLIQHFAKTRSLIQIEEHKLKEDQERITDNEEQIKTIGGKLMLYYRRILDPHLHTKSIDFIISEVPEAKRQILQEELNHQKRKSLIKKEIKKEMCSTKEQILSAMKEYSKQKQAAKNVPFGGYNPSGTHKVREHIFSLENASHAKRTLLKEEEERHKSTREKLLSQEKELEEIANSIAKATADGEPGLISQKRTEFLEACGKQKRALNEQLLADIASRSDRLTSLKNEMAEYENLIRTTDEQQTSEFDQFDKHIEELSKELKKKIDSTNKEKLNEYAQAYLLISRITHYVNNAQLISHGLPSAADYSKGLESVLLKCKENTHHVACFDIEHYSSEVLSEWAKQSYPSNSKVAEAIKELNFNGSILPQTLHNENNQLFLALVNITTPEDIKIWTTKWREEADKRSEATKNCHQQKRVLANIETLKLALSS